MLLAVVVVGMVAVEAAAFFGTAGNGLPALPRERVSPLPAEMAAVTCGSAARITGAVFGAPEFGVKALGAPVFGAPEFRCGGAGSTTFCLTIDGGGGNGES